MEHRVSLIVVEGATEKGISIYNVSKANLEQNTFGLMNKMMYF
jgi:hypothetical protein